MGTLTAGSLIHRVRLQAEQPAPDATFGDTTAFIDVAVLSARVESSGGREFYQQKKLTPELTHQVTIRYRPGVVGGMRFLFGDAVLRILAPVDPDGSRVQLMVMCQELVQ